MYNVKWKVVMCDSEEGKKLRCEDNSIFTVDGEEVVACSEWLTADDETLEYIVKLHNNSLIKGE